jgi:hypothetical protein
MIDHVQEIISCIEELQHLFQDLIIGGLRTIGPERLPEVESLRDEFLSIGAGHIATHLSALADDIREDRCESAGTLMRAQAAVQMFERVLTLEVVKSQLVSSMEVVAQ